MRCGQLVTENICVTTNVSSNRCTIKTVTIIEIKANNVCSANDVALVSYEEYMQPFPSLNPTTVAQVFSIGFSGVLFCFLVSRSMGVALNLIRKG